MSGDASLIRADARALPLPDASVDLIVTSPPYYAQRSYLDGGEHYAGQIGDEPTPGEYIDNLIACTAEWTRVLKPSGSIFLNLGDKYARPGGGADVRPRSLAGAGRGATGRRPTPAASGGRDKSLMLLPERYRIAAVDRLGLIAREVLIWDKPNPMPESVTDRAKRSHEDWVHLTKEPRYYSSVDLIREEPSGYTRTPGTVRATPPGQRRRAMADAVNPLGGLPSSVWRIAAEPLAVPPELGVDHFACVDTDTEILSRRGWLRHDEVQVGDEVAGHDLDTGVTSWTRCHAVHRYDFDGEMVSAEARGLSMRLTPNHRTLAHDHRGVHRTRGPVEVIDAADLGKRHSVPRAVVWAEDGREKAIGVDFAALLGWVSAEGWYSANRRLVYLSQSETVNPAKVEQIATLLDRLGDNPLRTTRARNWRGRAWQDVQWRLGAELAGLVLDAMPDKLLPAWVSDLPLDEARALLDAFVDGDGHRRADGRLSVFQKHRPNLDVLQAVAVRLGYNTTLRENGNRWVLYLSPPRPARLRRADGTSLVGRERYVGTVWCVTTGTGTFVARRRGSVFVTGNSFPTEWPRRIILGWSPSGICTACGDGRRPVVERRPMVVRPSVRRLGAQANGGAQRTAVGGTVVAPATAAITGEACACPDVAASTRPAVVLDPFGGTGTTALVAKVLGRHGISVDRSADYCRLATWRTTDPGEMAKAMRVPKPERQADGQMDLLAGVAL